MAQGSQQMYQKLMKVEALSGLNCRKEPNPTAEIITSFENETVLTVIGEMEGWYKVELREPDLPEREGYCSAKFMKEL